MDGRTSGALLCFRIQLEFVRSWYIWSVKKAGGLGVIVARSPSDYLYSYATHFPCVQVTYENMTEKKGKKGFK